MNKYAYIFLASVVAANVGCSKKETAPATAPTQSTIISKTAPAQEPQVLSAPETAIINKSQPASATSADTPQRLNINYDMDLNCARITGYPYGLAEIAGKEAMGGYSKDDLGKMFTYFAAEASTRHGQNAVMSDVLARQSSVDATYSAINLNSCVDRYNTLNK